MGGRPTVAMELAAYDVGTGPTRTPPSRAAGPSAVSVAKGATLLTATEKLPGPLREMPLLHTSPWLCKIARQPAAAATARREGNGAPGGNRTPDPRLRSAGRPSATEHDQVRPAMTPPRVRAPS